MSLEIAKIRRKKQKVQFQRYKSRLQKVGWIKLADKAKVINNNVEGNPSQIGERVDLTLDHDENQKVNSEELIENASVNGDGQNEEQINAQLEYEEGSIDYNIIHVSKARDLSPRHR